MDAAYWIWLQMGLGIASPAAQQVLGHRIDPRTLYRMSLEQMVQQEIFSAAVCARLRSVSLSTAQRIARDCMHKGYQIIALTDSAYPRQLYGLPDPPLVLYAQGNTALLNQLDELPALTVVGTRSANGYGKKVAHSFSYDLARAGFVILSGLAQGIDSCALEGALEAGGKTVTVLPTGLDYTSPAQSEPLRRRILENSGVVLSELAPQSNGFKGYFPARNRLLSALAQGVLVAQAPARSGALITATHALEQGRELFTIPASIYDAAFAGNLQLLRDGVMAAITPEDIARHYLTRFSMAIHLESIRGKPSGRNLPPKKSSYHIKEKSSSHSSDSEYPQPKQSSENRQKDEPQRIDASPVSQQEAKENLPQQQDDLPEEFLPLTEGHPSGYTRVQPGNVLDEQWKLEKIRLLQELSRKNPRPPVETIYVGQEEQPTAPTDVPHPAEPKEEQSTAAASSCLTIEHLTDEQRRVYQTLTPAPQDLADIAALCGMSIAQVTAMLFEIGVPDPVRVYPGNRFGL